MGTQPTDTNHELLQQDTPSVFILLALVKCSPLRKRQVGQVHLHNSLQRRLHTTAKKQKPDHPPVAELHGRKNVPFDQEYLFPESTAGVFWRLRSSYSSREILSACLGMADCRGVRKKK